MSKLVLDQSGHYRLAKLAPTISIITCHYY